MSSKAILITMSHLKFRPDRTRTVLKNIFLIFTAHKIVFQDPIQFC